MDGYINDNIYMEMKIPWMSLYDHVLLSTWVPDQRVWSGGGRGSSGGTRRYTITVLPLHHHISPPYSTHSHRPEEKTSARRSKTLAQLSASTINHEPISHQIASPSYDYLHIPPHRVSIQNMVFPWLGLRTLCLFKSVSQLGTVLDG